MNYSYIFCKSTNKKPINCQIISNLTKIYWASLQICH